VVLFGAGILVADVPGMATAWAIVSLTVVSAAVVVSRVSRHIRHDALTDQLTGTLNRTGLADAADGLGARRRRGEGRVAVAMLDLDGFKHVNDRHGHAAGDHLLVELTAAWRAALRQTDVLARTGGDEFVLIMPGTTAEEAGAVLARLERAHPARWSAGTVTWDPGESLEACLERADRRLYAAKSGRSLTV
jgi:diguanylate cyclase (GGDEF)-like protein